MLTIRPIQPVTDRCLCGGEYAGQKPAHAPAHQHLAERCGAQPPAQGDCPGKEVVGHRICHPAGGGTAIRTDNEENNPMLGINKALGFVGVPAGVNYEKEL